jgi:hypothetical protein
VFQVGASEDFNGRNNITTPLIMDEEYLKNIPKTGRDHYTNKAHQQPPIHPKRNTNYNRKAF